MGRVARCGSSPPRGKVGITAWALEEARVLGVKTTKVSPFPLKAVSYRIEQGKADDACGGDFPDPGAGFEVH